MTRRILILSALLVVIIAAVQYWRTKEPGQPWNEELMQQRLEQLRLALDKYRQAQGRYPRQLNDLVAVGVLPEFPVDPVTMSSTSWKAVRQDEIRLDDFLASARKAASRDEIVDIRSGAPGHDRNGVSWSEY